MRRMILMFWILAMLLTGCGGETGENGEKTLWIVTENTTADGMLCQVDAAVADFATKYPEVTCQVTVLPTDADERSLFLEELQLQIMVGEGPDVYLLPLTNSLPTGTLAVTQGEALFTDLYQAMQSGVFADVSDYYGADTTLEKDRLQSTVMDAGTIGNARYVLPLRYDYVVLCALPDELAASGYSLENLCDRFPELMRLCAQPENKPLACSTFLSWETNYLPYAYSDYMDHDRCQLLLTAEQIREYLDNYCQISTLAGTEYLPYGLNCLAYTSGELGAADPWPMITLRTLSGAMDCAAIAKAEGKEITMLPLRSDQGDLIAQVTYVGAVGANSREPELAYAFVRQFLQAEYQWEQNRVIPDGDLASGLIATGWPVLTRGAVEPLWQIQRTLNRSLSRTDGTLAGLVHQRNGAIANMTLTDGDISILDTSIDIVRFPVLAADGPQQVLQEIASALQQNDSELPDTVTAAQNLWDSMRFTLGEG